MEPWFRLEPRELRRESVLLLAGLREIIILIIQYIVSILRINKRILLLRDPSRFSLQMTGSLYFAL